MDIAPGTVLLGKYRVDEILGTGGMGRVVRASHLYLQQSVAIKILLPQMTESPSTVARFLREAQSTVKLKSEHVARVIDVGTMPDGTPFMVMEYLEGNDLNQILRHHGPQSPNIVVDLMLQACEGMSEAHAQGIVHRDIKPSNYFITRRADGSMLLKILDFGISKTPVGFEELTGTQTVIGTPSYMAPEQMKSGKHADQRSDIWSMGVVMYQLLQGRPPFSGDSYAELVLKVGAEPPAPLHVPLPAGLGEVILRCLEKDPKRRQQDVGELARSLAPFSSDPISAAQSAGRATRILQARSALPGFGQDALPLGAGGGLTTPVPLSPAQLTPRSWPPSSTSLSQGRGQMTLKTGTSRGWLIAGGLSLAILAGVGGFIASELRRKPAPATEPSVGPTVQMPVSAPSPTPPPSPAPVASDPVPATSAWKPTTPQPTIAPKAEPEKAAAAAPAKTETVTSAPTAKAASTTPAKTETAKAASTTPAKTETAKAASTTPAKTETAKAASATPAKTETKVPAKTETKAVAAKAPAKTEVKASTKTETKTPAKTAAKTPAKTPAKTSTKKPSGGDLFDSRH